MPAYPIFKSLKISSQFGNRMSQDKQNIDQLISLFFGIFSNARGQRPDWNLLRELCIPDVQIIRKQGNDTSVYDLESFIEPRQRLLTDGSLTHFEEQELEEETRLLGHLAQRLSRYRKSGYRSGVYFEEYGTKAFQLIRRGADWKIASLIWEDAAD